MRSRRQEKQSTHRRQEQEYRDKILTLNRSNYSELAAPIETKQCGFASRAQEQIDRAEELLKALRSGDLTYSYYSDSGKVDTTAEEIANNEQRLFVLKTASKDWKALDAGA
jgi:hypothetical protein